MSRVSDILARKGSEVHTVPQDATVLEAVTKMVEMNVGSVLITEGEAIRGIFTERDYLRRIVLEGRTSKATPVGKVMSTRIVCVDPSYTVEECLAIETEKRIRHLPVMDEGRLVGLVSIGDLVKHLIKEQEIHIHYLTDYISGKYPG
jgi:CBS domain-containing protein